MGHERKLENQPRSFSDRGGLTPGHSECSPSVRGPDHSGGPEDARHSWTSGIVFESAAMSGTAHANRPLTFRAGF